MTGAPLQPLTVAMAALVAEDPQRILEATKAKYVYPWWESNDAYVLFEKQIQEPVLLVPFARFHEAAEIVLGRTVIAIEFTKPEKLDAEWRELKGRA